MTALQRNAPALGLPLVLIGGWMAGHSSMMLLAAPLVIACGLVGAGLLRSQTANQRWVVYIGVALAVLLSIGAYQQWRNDSIMAVMAIGFAAAMVLTALSAGLPRESLLRGMVTVRALAFASAGWAVVQVAQGVERASGLLSLNPNAQAGFLLLVAVQWLTAERGSRRSVFGSFVLLSAATLTGSRWAMIVLAGVLVLLLARRVISLRSALMLSLVLVVFVGMMAAGAGRFDGSVDIGNNVGALGERITETAVVPSLIPQGFLGPLKFGDGGHNVFHRVAVEAGWVGLALFVGVVALAFVRANGHVRIALGVFMALGVADYYIWGPFQLAPLMWAYFGLGVQSDA